MGLVSFLGGVLIQAMCRKELAPESFSCTSASTSVGLSFVFGFRQHSKSQTPKPLNPKPERVGNLLIATHEPPSKPDWEVHFNRSE